MDPDLQNPRLGDGACQPQVKPGNSTVEESEQGGDSFGEGVKFPSQQRGTDVECQSHDDKGGADVEGEGQQKDIELWKDPGEDPEDQPGKEQDGEHRSAELHTNIEHMGSQAHQIGHCLAAEIELARREEGVGLDRQPEKKMVAVEGEKNENGKDILELGDQRHLAIAGGIKDVGSGKAHLVTDHRTAKLNGSEHQPGDEAHYQPEQGLINDKKEKGQGLEGDRGQLGGKGGKEDQGAGKCQTDSHPSRCLG